ncbi:hypothetical protein GP486_008016 [Trichoglossum hirsutum]|uniref:Uncharacterized protein n=1 Tax=Trichoglossum hirsutum TaxID=265104 RepID=A0A9P8IEU7_9PEZI|nr:hypothetical protein GP486_008016 [Trichoglossum hirsutum]
MHGKYYCRTKLTNLPVYSCPPGGPGHATTEYHWTAAEYTGEYAECPSCKQYIQQQEQKRIQQQEQDRIQQQEQERIQQQEQERIQQQEQERIQQQEQERIQQQQPEQRQSDPVEIEEQSKPEEQERVGEQRLRQESPCESNAVLIDSSTGKDIKYERSEKGPFPGKFVCSERKVITIDGEDYVEYRVLRRASD